MRVGRGSVFKRKDSPYWWIKWYRDGKSFRESTNTIKKTDAQAVLAKRLGAVARGEAVSPSFDRLLFKEAAADVVTDYQVNGKKSVDSVERRIRKHLDPFFGGRRMITISSADIRAFIAKRQADQVVVQAERKYRADDGTLTISPAVTKPVSNAEINRELAVLKRMFTLAVQSGKLAQKPHVPLLAERNVRQGFFEREQFEAVASHLPDALRSVVEFAYITGWRIPSEVLTLQWRQVDWLAGEVRLDPGTTKNSEGRVFPMTSALRTLLEQRKGDRPEGRICPWVFHRGGAQIRSFRKAFIAACRAAGCPGRIPHDFRRTAVRNLVRAGVPERVAMQMTGHKTRSVFERYNIVSQGDLRLAVEKLEQATVADRRALGKLT